MYIVVSKWGILGGMSEEVKQRSQKLRETLRSQPGVQFLHNFLNEDGVAVQVVGYDSEEAYRKIVFNPEGAFQKALAESQIEKYGVWVGSERGESMD